jgi:hypothetical protein
VLLHGDRGGSSENLFTGWDGIGLEGIFSYLDVFKDLSEGKNKLMYCTLDPDV